MYRLQIRWTIVILLAGVFREKTSLSLTRLSTLLNISVQFSSAVVNSPLWVTTTEKMAHQTCDDSSHRRAHTALRVHRRPTAVKHIASN